MRRFASGVLVAALSLAACNNNHGSGGPPPGGYAVFREGETVRRYRGQWALPSGASMAARAEAFLAAPPVQLTLPVGVSRGAGVVVGRNGDTVVFPLEAAGIPIDGGEIRVHTIRDWVVAVTIRTPSVLGGSNVPVFSRDDAVALVSARESGLEMRGTPELRFVMPAMLTGEPAPAVLHWRIALDDTVAHRPRVYYVNANDGAIGWIEPLSRRVVRREVWDCHGAGSESRCREERTNRTYETTSDAPTQPDPSAEATYAHELGLAACDRFERLYGDDVACDPVVAFTGFGAASGYAAQQEGMLFFGPGALSHPDARIGYQHEIAHALTYQHLSLVGSLEPGAVGEAYADLNAMFAEQPGHWQIRNADSMVVRDLENPRSTSQPTRYDDRRTLESTWMADETNDWGEVHANSTILSHAMWIATMDGVSVRGTDYPGIGVEKAEQILYVALTEYSGRMTTLRQAADDLASACNREATTSLLYETTVLSDHWFITPHDCGVLRNAFAEVGLLEEDRDLDSWPDSADICPDAYNPLQALAASGLCEEETPFDLPDAGPPDRDAGPILTDFPDAPTDVPTCPAMIAFTARAFPPVTITLDDQSAPTCTSCAGGRGAGYSVTCRYRQAATGGGMDSFFDIQLLWQPWDRSMVRVDDTTGPSNHDHCGDTDRAWVPGATGGGTAYSHTNSAVVFTPELPSAGATDEERDRLYFILDQLEMLAAPCP
ncbi:MAG: M4 family metallopeptidase [Sandaracinaceae bacterium]